MDRVESAALPYLNSPNYNYGTAIASTSTGNEIFENVMKQATISSMLNDESQGQGTASGGTEEASEQDDGSRYSEDLRKAWETLRAQEDAFYRTSQAARAARKPLTNTANSTFASTAGASASGASASTAAAAQTLTAADSSGTVTVDTPYEVASDGTVTMEQIFQKAAAKYGVSSNLLKAVAKVESGYQPDVVSSAGAIGVMQLMPGTASSLGVTNAYDAEQNIMGGAKLLSQLLNQYNNNLDLALAAYNAGPGNVAKYGGAPPYTQKYISMIKSIMNNGEQTINVPVTISSASASSSDLSVAASAASTENLTGQSSTDAALAALSSLSGGSSSSLATLLGSNSSALTALLGNSSTSSLASLLGSNSSTLSALSALSGGSSSGSSTAANLYQLLALLASTSGSTTGNTDSSAATNILSSLSSSGEGNTLGNLAKLAELQTLNSAASTFSNFGSDDDDDNSLI